MKQRLVQPELKSNGVIANIPDAQVASDDLRCTVKVNIKVNETKGKALVVDTLPLNNKLTETTLLQQDKKKAWIAFKTIHPSNETIEKSFIERNKTDEDRNLFLVPFLLIIALMGFLEFYLIKKTVIDKEPIILTEADWYILMLVTALLFSLMSFLTYYIYNMKNHKITFSSYTHHNIDTYIFYFNGVLYKITAVVYHGRYTNEEMPDKELYGYGPSDLEGGLVSDDGLFFSEQIKIYKMDQRSIIEEKAQYLMGIEDKKIRFDVEMQILKERGVSAVDLAAKEEEINLLTTQKTEQVQRFNESIKKTDESIEELITNYHKKLKEVIDKNIERKRAEQILNSNATISALNIKLADEKTNNLQAHQNIGVLYEGGVKRTMQYKEHLSQFMADQQMSKVELEISNIGENGTVNGQSRDMDWGPMINTTYNLVLTGIFVYFILWIMGQVVAILSEVGPSAVIVGIIAFLGITMVINRAISKLVGWSNNADITVQNAR